MKFPFIQCFTGDWLKDPAVSMLSPAARGIWWDFICVMHESDRSGMVTGSRPMLARLVRCSTDELGGALNEIQLCKTGDVVQDENGIVTVINRRMRREHLDRELAAKRQKTHRERLAGDDPVTPLSRDIVHSSESESERAEARAHDAVIPTILEVKTYAEMHGIPEDSAQNFFEYHEGNALWLNQHSRLISWRAKLKSWSEKDRQMGGPHGNNGKTKPQRIDRNAGTANEGDASEYSGLKRSPDGRLVKA